MNAAQAGRLNRLLLDATHPRTCPITGEPYSEEEMADFNYAGAPSVGIKGYDRERPDAPEMMEVYLLLPGVGAGARELFLDPQGRVWVWSTVQVPAEECPCTCDEPEDRAFGGPERCARHGKGVCEIECYRRVSSCGWQITYDPSSINLRAKLATDSWVTPRWRYVVHEGDAIRDVLAEYQLARALGVAG